MLEHLSEYFSLINDLNRFGKANPLASVSLTSKLADLGQRTQSQHLRNRISVVLQEPVKTTA
jgi:hypothetical protein